MRVAKDEMKEFKGGGILLPTTGRIDLCHLTDVACGTNVVEQ